MTAVHGDSRYTTTASYCAPAPDHTHLGLDLTDGVPERLALDLSNLELEGRGLAGTVAASEGAGTPGRAYVTIESA